VDKKKKGQKKGGQPEKITVITKACLFDIGGEKEGVYKRKSSVIGDTILKSINDLYFIFKFVGYQRGTVLGGVGSWEKEPCKKKNIKNITKRT